jgi:hypothetical protein
MSQNFREMNPLHLYHEIRKQSKEIRKFKESGMLPENSFSKYYLILAQNLNSLGYEQEANEHLDLVSKEYLSSEFVSDLVISGMLMYEVIKGQDPLIADPGNNREFLESVKILHLQLEKSNHPLLSVIKEKILEAFDIAKKKIELSLN